MTTTSAGPSGFHTKHFVAAFAVAGFVAAILVIAQWLGSDSRPVLPPTDHAVTEVAVSESSVSANWEAFAAGKFDDAPAPSAPATAAIESVPEASGVTGTSGNWDNYRDGKFEDTGATAAVEFGTSGNFQNYRDGKFEDAEAQPRTYERAVAGGHQEF